MVGSDPFGLFVTTNNTLYVVFMSYNYIQVWLEGNTNPTRIISGNISNSYSLFVTSSGDIYVDNGASYGRVDKWLSNTTSSTPAMYVPIYCYSLFIDLNNTLYCSLTPLQQVIAKSLDDVSNTLKTVAGTGCVGSTSNMLRSPRGIFVDINFNLYVADSNNDRIQLFQSGQQNAKTVAGNGALETITLLRPISVVLDGDGYLFIVDSNNNRIVGSGPNGFRCIVGCSGVWGSTSYQLYYPQTMAFDSYGNIFVVDTDNSRIQKFVLASNVSGKHQHVS
jgi:sugar lactone lactonase YvrE